MDYLWTPWRFAYITGGERSLRASLPEALAAWPGDMGCVFCNLVAATAYAVEHGMPQSDADRAANIVARGEHCFLVLNAFPYASGHVMVVPYQHLDNLHGLPAAAAAEMMTWAQRLDKALRDAYRPDGVNLGMNLGQAAGAGVAGHIHLHALPRWVGDTNFMTTIAETRVLPEMLAEAMDKLKKALGS